MRVRVSRPVLTWFEGSQAWFDESEGESYELFTRLRLAKVRADGSVVVDLDDGERELLAEWASYLETAARDDASWDPSARGELNAARALQRKLERPLLRQEEGDR